MKLIFYDLLGREIKRLVDEEQTAGWKEMKRDARQTAGGQDSQLASGMYLVRLQSGSFAETKKIILMK